MQVVWGILVGLVGMVIGFFAGMTAGFPLLKALGVSDFEGKAAYYAAFFIGIPLAIAGFVLGFLLVRYLAR